MIFHSERMGYGLLETRSNWAKHAQTSNKPGRELSWLGRRAALIYILCCKTAYAQILEININSNPFPRPVLFETPKFCWIIIIMNIFGNPTMSCWKSGFNSFAQINEIQVPFPDVLLQAKTQMASMAFRVWKLHGSEAVIPNLCNPSETANWEPVGLSQMPCYHSSLLSYLLTYKARRK